MKIKESALRRKNTKANSRAKEFGIGLRPEYYDEILARETAIDWFEITPENYMGLENHGRGRPYKVLKKIAEKYPLAFHGVTMSLGSVDALNKAYLKNLKTLVDEFKPFAVSDHLCFSSLGGEYVYDLLPLPYTEESAKNIIKKIKQAQDYLGRKISIENVSSYLEYKASSKQEWEFLSHIVEESGCGLILDINNVFVSSVNHDFDATAYLSAIPQNAVDYIHLAGHSRQGAYLIDTHDHDVPREVWNLYREYIEKFGRKKTMIERDANMPKLQSLEAELAYARKIVQIATQQSAARGHHKGAFHASDIA